MRTHTHSFFWFILFFCLAYFNLPVYHWFFLSIVTMLIADLQNIMYILTRYNFIANVNVHFADIWNQISIKCTFLYLRCYCLRSMYTAVYPNVIVGNSQHPSTQHKIMHVKFKVCVKLLILPLILIGFKSSSWILVQWLIKPAPLVTLIPHSYIKDGS